jgi:hypothetical protein
VVRESVKTLKKPNGELKQEDIEEDGELPFFEVNLVKNLTKFEDLDPNDINYEMYCLNLKHLNKTKHVVQINFICT